MVFLYEQKSVFGSLPIDFFFPLIYSFLLPADLFRFFQTTLKMSEADESSMPCNSVLLLPWFVPPRRCC